MFEEVRERFKQKNIERFLRQLFPFEREQNSLIASEVIRLCAVIGSEYKSEFSEMEFLISEAQKHIISNRHQKLHDVVESISKNRKLGVHFLPAFLASDLLLTSYDHKKFDQYKALTFLCVARLSFLGKHKPKIKAICDDVRLFSNGQRESMAAYLPDINLLNLPLLVKAFNVLVDRENEARPPSQVVDQLNKYRRPYESTLKDAEGYTRTVTSSEFKKSGRLEPGELKTLDEEAGDTVFELKQFSETPKSGGHSWQKEDHHGERSRTMSIVSAYSHTKHSYATGALHARAIQARIEKRELYLACDIDSATNYEIGSLTGFCVAQIKTQSPDFMAAKLLLLMLITGDTYDQIEKLKCRRSANNRMVGFYRKHRLPSQTQRTEVQPLLVGVSNEFWLPLPQIVCGQLSNLKFRNVEEQQLKAILQKINEQKQTSLTLRKVSSYLKQKLSHENIDSTIIALLSGAPINTVPALFYVQLSSELLLSTYYRYLDFLSHLTSTSSVFTEFDEYPLPLTLGSPLYLEVNVLSSLVSKLQDKLSSTDQHSEQFHNCITIYTQLVLAIGSGYRPVTGWFGKITHLSLQTGDYWISDKESGVGDNSRVVKLPQIAVNILDDYLRYCSDRGLRLANINPELSREYQCVLSGENHLFFYVKEHQLMPCTPSNYSLFIDPILPLQANWARHHVRSLLTANNVDAPIINAWMGHMNHSKRSFHEYSALSRQDMRLVSTLINAHLVDIGVRSAYE